MAQPRRPLKYFLAGLSLLDKQFQPNYALPQLVSLRRCGGDAGRRDEERQRTDPAGGGGADSGIRAGAFTRLKMSRCCSVSTLTRSEGASGSGVLMSHLRLIWEQFAQIFLTDQRMQSHCWTQSSELGGGLLGGGLTQPLTLCRGYSVTW